MSKATSFEDAYRILDQAANDQTAPSLRELISGELHSLQAAIVGEVSESKDQLARGSQELSGLARELGTLASGHIGELRTVANREVRANPILFIGAAAVGALALGFLLSRPTRSIREVAEIPPRLPDATEPDLDDADQAAQVAFENSYAGESFGDDFVVATDATSGSHAGEVIS